VEIGDMGMWKLGDVEIGGCGNLEIGCAPKPYKGENLGGAQSVVNQHY